MLSGTEDPFGNHILYDYVRDSDVDSLRSQGLPTPSDSQAEFHHWDELYLERIRYVDYDNNVSAAYLISVTWGADVSIFPGPVNISRFDQHLNGPN
jgi:hypothetical protein